MPEDLIQILFKVLFGFVVLNIFINATLLYIKRKKIYKLLALFWPLVLLVFIAQALVQDGELAITLAATVSFGAILVFSMIGFKLIGREFPLRNYAILMAFSYIPTFYAAYKGMGFTAMSLPPSLATMVPLLHTFSYIMFIDRKKSSTLLKVLGLVYLGLAIHSLNFAFFRMDPGAQLWGWVVAYAIYDTMAILLPSIALEKAHRSENERLQMLVNEKTADLSAALKENEKLIKILVHDISNPLQLMNYYFVMGEKDAKMLPDLQSKVKKAHGVIEGIVQQVKELYSNKKVNLNAVSVDECFNEISFLFAESLKKKNINLKLNNELPPGVQVLADKNSFTHSVLSNLISNGLKFSEPNTEIEVVARLEEKNVVLEVRDRGPGISKEVINGLMRNEVLMSSIGTSGERGSGFGLSIVKSYVETFGGQIEFESSPVFTNPQNHGTNVRIILDQAQPLA